MFGFIINWASPCLPYGKLSRHRAVRVLIETIDEDFLLKLNIFIRSVNNKRSEACQEFGERSDRGVRARREPVSRLKQAKNYRL